MSSAARARIRPAVLLQASLLLSVISNLGRIPVFSLGKSAAPVLVNDLMVAVVLAGGALAAARSRSIQVDSVAILAFLFAGVGGLSALIAVPRLGLTAFELGVSLAYLARWLFYFGIYLVVINWVQRRDVASVWAALEWMLLAFAAFGIVQAIFLPGFAFVLYPDAVYDWDAQGHRLVSTVLEPNIAAAMLMVGLVVQLGQISAGATVSRWKPALLLAAMVLTLSRSGALGLFFGGLTILTIRGLNRRLLRAGALIAIVIVVSLPWLIPFAAQYEKLRLGGSALGRIVNLAQVISAFRDSPWIGIGFNTFGFFMERQGVERGGVSTQSQDGGLLFALGMTGIIGLSIFLLMLWRVVRRCRAIWRDDAYSPMERGLCTGVAAGIVSICVDSVFVNSLFSTVLLQPLWVLWGLTHVIATKAREPLHAESALPRVVALGRP